MAEEVTDFLRQVIENEQSSDANRIKAASALAQIERHSQAQSGLTSKKDRAEIHDEIKRMRAEIAEIEAQATDTA